MPLPSITRAANGTTSICGGTESAAPVHVKGRRNSRIHGADGLREFTSAKGIARLRFAGPLAIATFARTSSNDRLMLVATKVLRGRRRPDPR